MGFFKSLFSNKALAEDIIKAMEKTYWRVKKEKPGEDEHFYLASTLLRRFEVRKKLGQDLGLLNHKESLNLIVFNETMTFSILDPPESIRALSLYIVYKEVPSEAYRYEDEFNKIMEPVLKMEENGTFMSIYRKKNPTIAKQMSELYKPE
jgi:hypothetical protein